MPFEERRLQPTLGLWRRVVAEEQERLRQDAAARPQVPTLFVAGPTLKSRDAGLFRGRQDLVQLIDHDLSDTRRGVLLLYGQRRMGKSSLVERLPTQLGARTLVASLNFQGLSGEVNKARPHLLVANAVSKAAGSTPPAPSDAWRPALDWLRNLDETLATTNRRLLIPIDEIERLEDGRREGWVGTDFLDFLRAAGDELRVTRFLLASAHRPARLGPVWVDRLISALPRELGPLDEDSARSLLVEPEPNFPDIYPPGGVDHILERTGCHPYLLQLVGDELTRHLNTHQRLKATDDDLDEAFGQALLKAGSILFQNLWNDRSDPERAVLLAAATGATLATPDPATRQDLLRDGFLRPDGQLATPLFAEWIAQRGGAGA